MKNQFKIQLTAEYNRKEGVFAPVSRLSMNERINHRATSPYHALELSSPRVELTKAQKLLNYECRCIENDTKPFHYSEEQWEQHLRNVESDERAELCEARNSWMYQH